MKTFSIWLRSNYKILAIIALVVFVSYGNILRNELVWDDKEFMEWDVMKTFPASLGKIVSGQLLIGNITNYRPVKNIIYGFDYFLWHDSAFWYHVQGILVQFAASVLVYIFSLQITESRKISAGAALLFAVHPIHVEAISWATAAVDSFGHLFYLVALICYVVATKKTKSRKNLRFLSLSFASLAFFTNELSFSLPVVLFLYEVVFRTKRNYKKILTIQRPFWLLLFIYFFIRFVVLNIQSNHIWLLNSPVSTVLITFRVLMKYVSLLIWPVHLSINHTIYEGVTTFYNFDNRIKFLTSIKYPTLTDPLIFFSVLMLLLWLIIMYKWRHNKKWVFYSLFLLITLLPVSQIMPTTTLFAERYLYLASIPFCILLSESVVWITSRLDTKWRQQILVGIVGLLVVMYGLRTIIRNQVWTNSYTLWSLAYKDTPNSTIVLSNLGVYYAQKGEFDQALPYFQKAAELHPDSVPVQLNLANTYHKLGRDELWLIHLKTADEIQKNGN